MGRAFDLDFWDLFLDYNQIRILMIGFSKKNPPNKDNTVIITLKDGFIMLHKTDYQRIVDKISRYQLPGYELG